MKRAVAYTVVLVLLLSFASTALAVGRVTPDEPANPEIRLTFGAWVEETLVPYLRENSQEKWSAKFCHQVADMVEAAGFPISEEDKDELYRVKRDHRLIDDQALRLVVATQFGDFWEWTPRDWGWTDEMVSAAGMWDDPCRDTANCYAVPPEDSLKPSELYHMAREAISAQYGLSEAELDAYDVFICYVLSEGQPFWNVNVLKEWGSYPLDFYYRYDPTVGTGSLEDLRKDQR